MPLPPLAGLNASVAESAAAALMEAEKAGWTLTLLRWSDQSTRELEFSAQTAGSKVYYTFCGEDELVEELQSLLDME